MEFVTKGRQPWQPNWKSVENPFFFQSVVAFVFSYWIVLCCLLQNKIFKIIREKDTIMESNCFAKGKTTPSGWYLSMFTTYQDNYCIHILLSLFSCWICLNYLALDLSNQALINQKFLFEWIWYLVRVCSKIYNYLFPRTAWQCYLFPWILFS